jgi:hypothetical protein
MLNPSTLKPRQEQHEASLLIGKYGVSTITEPAPGNSFQLLHQTLKQLEKNGIGG